MGALREQTEVLEFIILERAVDLAEAILARRPRIIGFGVYIWNVEETAKLVGILKQVDPEVVIVLGGPEVSYETSEQSLSGDLPKEKVIRTAPPAVSEIELPYRFYTDDDIAHRLIYVEASRGCPFRCEFCLSALDDRVTPFGLASLFGRNAKVVRPGRTTFQIRRSDLRPEG